MGGAVGLSLSVDPRNGTPAATVDDNVIRGDVDGRLRNRARSTFQNRLCLLRATLLVYIPAGQELLEQSYLSVWHRGQFVLGNAGE